MSDLVEGLEHIHEFVAGDELLTDVEGTLSRRVLSTPGIILQMEIAASRCIRDRLPPGRTTVGFEVCIRHVAGAPEGARCTARASLREVVDGRKLRFDVEVRDGERVLGIGTHERRVISPG
jgi:fluoroacetyl-CoA thioesterase